MNVPITVLSETRWWKDGKERAHSMIREWLLGTDQTRRYGLLLRGLVQVKNCSLFHGNIPRHGQERSRKQRGLWINKFCELIVNASPKAPVNKTFTGVVFCTTAVFLTLLCHLSLCVCKISFTCASILHCWFLLCEYLRSHRKNYAQGSAKTAKTKP